MVEKTKQTNKKTNAASEILDNEAEKLSLFILAQAIVCPNPKAWLFPCHD